MSSKNQLLGTWNLIEFSALGEDNSKIYPFGINVRGLLIYQPNMLMSAQLGNVLRANFENEDHRKGHNSEIIESFNNYISYFGNYWINETNKFIIHDIHQSLFPNWIGKKVKRFYELENNILILKASPIMYEILRTPTLIWQKIE